MSREEGEDLALSSIQKPETRIPLRSSKQISFDPAHRSAYAAGMDGEPVKTSSAISMRMFRHAPLPKSYTDYLGRKLIRALLTAEEQ